jgi:transposase
MENYIGLDAHSKSCTFVVVNVHGREVAAKRVKTSEGELVAFVRSVRGEKYLTYEESNLSKWLFALFEGEVDEQVVCNPLYITKRKGAKGDYGDSLHLAQQLRGGLPTPVIHENHFLFELRVLVSAYQALVDDLAKLKCRYKALFRSQAQITLGTTIYRDPSRPKGLKTEIDCFVAEEYFSRIRQLEEVKSGYQKQFTKYARDVAEIRYLRTIPGIAAVRACIIAALVATPKRFKNKHKFWAYCELVRKDFVSDGECYTKKTVPANRFLKHTFMCAAQRCLDYNSDIRGVYQNMLEKGLTHKAARKNIARMLAAIVLAVMRKKEPYDPSIWKRKYFSKAVSEK